MWNAAELPRATGVETKPDATVKLGAVIDGPDCCRGVDCSQAMKRAAAVRPVRVNWK
jgi:hypothetical protein